MTITEGFLAYAAMSVLTMIVERLLGESSENSILFGTVWPIALLVLVFEFFVMILDLIKPVSNWRKK